MISDENLECEIIQITSFTRLHTAPSFFAVFGFDGSAIMCAVNPYTIDFECPLARREIPKGYIHESQKIQHTNTRKKKKK